MLNLALSLATLLLSVALLLCCYRLWRGPQPWDRVLALDTLYIAAIGLLVVQNIRQNSSEYFEAALLIAALGFFATVAAAKYLMRVEPSPSKPIQHSVQRYGDNNADHAN